MTIGNLEPERFCQSLGADRDRHRIVSIFFRQSNCPSMIEINKKFFNNKKILHNLGALLCNNIFRVTKLDPNRYFFIFSVISDMTAKLSVV